MQQNSPGFKAEAQSSFPGNTNGALVQDVLKLLKQNEQLQEVLQEINFNVHTYNNRLLMGNVGYRATITSSNSSISSSPGLSMKSSGLGLRLSTSEAGGSGGSFYSTKDSVEYNLYCINVRALQKKVDPSLAIIKLSNIDNLLSIEQNNISLQESLWRTAMCSGRFQAGAVRPIEKYFIPEYKYVFCSVQMIKQIENAFFQDEVSFPPETFAKYLE